MIGTAFSDYVDLVHSAYAPVTYDYYMGSSLTWTVVKQQINAGHPMVFLVDSSGDGYTDHFVPVIGYDESGGPMYAFWDTWDTNVQWAQFRPMSSSYLWGVYCGTSFDLQAGAPDTTPPVTTASGGGAKWHKAAVTVTLTPTDSGSGMVGGQAGTWYKIDSGSYTEGLHALVSGNGVHTVHYYSKDNLGNTETAKSCTVKIDSDGPVTSITKVSVRKGRTATLRYQVTDLTPTAKTRSSSRRSRAPPRRPSSSARSRPTRRSSTGSSAR